MANPINLILSKASKTIEARMVNAIINENDMDINALISEAETLLENEYLTPNEFNTITDVELMTEMLG